MRLTRQEIVFVTMVLLVLVLGAGVKHYRDRARLAAVLNAPAPDSDKAGTPATAHKPATAEPADQP